MRRAVEVSRGIVMAGLFGLLLLTPGSACADDKNDARTLRLAWDREILTIRGDHLPGGAVEVLYIEAYCRPGSTRRTWDKTVIPHRTELVEAAADGSLIRLRSRLDDGVVVDHEIRAGRDEVDFRVVASNPTGKASEVDWAQPCIRVHRYAGVPFEPSSEKYLPRCFLFIGGRPVRMPTTPWAREAIYTPGQVWCPAGVNRDDVNPRPLSPIAPSNGLIGCISADGKELLATAWEPYQELFQGVIVCLHSDFRIGGLRPGQSRTIRGKIYLMPADIPALLERYHRDFPGQETTGPPAAPTAGPARKLIEFGWDEPGTSFLRAHLAEMERTPFDGCVFHVDTRSPAGAPASLTWQGWGKKTFSAEDATPARRDLEAVAASTKRFHDNFLRFNTTPADLEWFDDHAAVIANARLAAELARAGRARGILLDTEQYEGKLFDYRRQRDASRHSWAEYAVQARLRGCEVMTAMQEGYPGLTVFLTFGDSLVWKQSEGGKKPLAECSYGLLAPFLDGLIDAARDGTRIVDGHEPSYGYREAPSFIEARRTILRDAASLASDRAAFAKRVSAGFGLWLDYDWRKLGWNADDSSKNYFTPQGFETALRAALEQSDEYVWVYSETPRWWSEKSAPVALPAAYSDAARRARRALAGDEPPRSPKPPAAPSGQRTDANIHVPIGQPYGAGQGPGIAIAAAGPFQLYFDGELLAEGSTAGAARFIPMTFLPGRHTLAIAANRVHGEAPGVLVQVDELERTYTSGAGWKAMSMPAGDWTSNTYEDDFWQEAARVADLSTRPATGLPAAALASSARWIWSPRADDVLVSLRWTFTIQAEGFGRGTTGGARGKRVVATSADDLARLAARPGPLTILIPEGVYDFRRRRKTIACANPNDPRDPSKGVTYRIPVGKNDFGCEPGAKKVEVERWERVIRLASDKSLIGMGRGAYLRGASFYLRRPHHNVILRNLCIYDVNPHLVEARDGIEAVDASDLWVDHCTFRWISDGNDMTGKEGVRGVTFSWVHYNGANQFVYRGQDHYAALLHNAEITYHHVWWDDVAGRAPKATGAGCRVHVYNNLHTHNPYFAIAAGEGAQVRVEASQFRDVRFPTEREGGSIDSRGNIYRDITAGHRVSWQPAEEPKDPVFSPPYPYSPDLVESVPDLLRRRSGVGGPWGMEPEY